MFLQFGKAGRVLSVKEVAKHHSFVIIQGFPLWEIVEIIKVLEEEFRKTHEKLDKIEQELKRLEEENEEGSEIMQNDLIFTSAGELLNSKKEE